MSPDDDVERQLRSFGETLRQQVGESIAPTTGSTRLSDRSGIDHSPEGPDRRRWVAMASAAAMVALVVGLLAVVQVDDGADAPVATEPTALNPTTAATSSTTTVPPAPPELTRIDHVVLLDGEAVGEPWTTGVADDADELVALWGNLALEEGVPVVDFTTDVVLYFNPAESGSCRFGPLDDVAYDPDTGRVFPVLADEDPDAGVVGEERECTADANPHAIVVQVARRDLPPTDFVVWVDNLDPPPGVLNGVTRVAAGELVAPPPTTAPTETSVDAPAQAQPSQLVAINADGDAVLLSDPSAEPVVLFDGPSQSELDANEEGPGPNVTDHVSVTPDGSLAFVGTCCEPISGAYLVTEPPAVATYDRARGTGYNPTVSPDGSLLAVGSTVGVVMVSDLATERQLTIENASGIPDDFGGAFTPYDLAWSSTDAFGVLGIFEGDWVVVPGTVNDDGLVVLGGFFRVGSFDGNFNAPFQFAGYRAEGGFLVHRTGDATATAFGLDGTDAGDIDLGGPALSAWLEPDEAAVRVDEQGTLTVGALVVSGEYRWARSGSFVR